MIETLLSKMIKTGDLTAHLPGGRVIKAGDGSGPPVVIRINGRGLRRLANPSLGLGEGYMEGDIVFEQGSIVQIKMESVFLSKLCTTLQHGKYEVVRHKEQRCPAGSDSGNHAALPKSIPACDQHRSSQQK